MSYLYKYPEQLSSEEGNDITQGTENGDCPAELPARESSLLSCIVRNDEFLAGNAIYYLYAVFICTFLIPASEITVWIKFATPPH